jgi:hypothetical protein
LRQNSEQELEGPAGLESAVGEIAMVAGTDAEHAQHIQRDTQDHGLSGHSGPHRSAAREMGQQERDGGWIDDVLVLVVAAWACKRLGHE